jgi:hypothetical protein
MHAGGRGATAIGILAMVLHGSIELCGNKKKMEKENEIKAVLCLLNMAHENI